MTQDQQTKSRGGLKGLSRWVLRRSNVRMARKIRGGRERAMGMDLLVLHTVGRHSGQPRETPVAWFGDSADSWLVIGSGGSATRHPDWLLNLTGRPDDASIELPGRDAVPVTPRMLDGTEREHAWKSIVAAQPRFEKYQRRSDREYPVVRLTPR